MPENDTTLGSQTTPGQEVTASQQNLVTPNVTENVEPKTEEKQGAEPLTEQKVLEIAQKAADEASERTIRKFQSLTDKAEQRVKKEVEQVVTDLKAAGIEVSQQQKAELENKTRQRVQSDSNQVGQVAQPAPQGEPVDPTVERVQSRAHKLEEKYGVTIAQNDPEVKLVTWDNPDPFQFLDQYEVALKAKVDRTKANSSASNKPSDGNAAGRVTATSNTKSGIPDLSPEELLKQVYPLP